MLTKSVICLCQWEFLNHAVDVLQFCELDCLFRISGMTARPGLYRESISDLSDIQQDYRSIAKEHPYHQAGIDCHITRNYNAMSEPFPQQAIH